MLGRVVVIVCYLARIVRRRMSMDHRAMVRSAAADFTRDWIGQDRCNLMFRTAG